MALLFCSSSCANHGFDLILSGCRERSPILNSEECKTASTKVSMFVQMVKDIFYKLREGGEQLREETR